MFDCHLITFVLLPHLLEIPALTFIALHVDSSCSWTLDHEGPVGDTTAITQGVFASLEVLLMLQISSDKNLKLT